MPDYDASRATAERLISNFGRGGTATITRRTAGIYDPVADAETGATSASYAVPCAVVPASARQFAYGNDDLAVSASEIVYIAAPGLPIEPQPGDIVQLPNRTGSWSVVASRTLAPDGNAIFHKLMCERTSR